MPDLFNRLSSRPTICWPANNNKSQPEEATYIVIGNPHGGTTLVAGLLRIMGVFMGQQIDSWTQEDIAMRSDNPKLLIATVKSRNADFKKWGWKRPGNVEYLKSLKPFLRKPSIIHLLRDPYATTVRSLSSGNRDPLGVLKECISNTQRQLELVNTLAVPTLFISYEMALKRPKFLIEDLAQFLGKSNIDASLEEELLSYINPEGGYKGNITPPKPLPVIDQFPKALEPKNCNFEPLEFVRPYGVQRQGHKWTMNLVDPHCFVSDDNVVRLLGKRRIRLDLRIRDNRLIEPSIYLDMGYGLREEHRIRFGKLGSGVWDFAIDFPKTTGAVRFDPDETSGTIEKLLVFIS